MMHNIHPGPFDPYAHTYWRALKTLPEEPIYIFTEQCLKIEYFNSTPCTCNKFKAGL